MRTLAKSISIMIAILAFALVLNAHSEYYSQNPEEKTAKHILIKSESPTEILASLDNTEIKEERKSLEEWMFQKNFKSIRVEVKKNIEKWMNEPEFWKIKDVNDTENIEEEDIQVEEWMIQFEKTLSFSQCDQLKEQEWMKKQSFIIL